MRAAAMRMSLEQSVLEHIRSEHLLSPGDRVGVAVSGGADSVALLRILEGIRRDLGVTLSVVHFNHGLRDGESELDEQFVAEMARTGGLDLIADRAEVAAEARANGWNLEDAARRLRYAFFQRVIQHGRATRIAVAHTADDQAETVIAHLIRGTGPTGLAAIYPIAGAIVRPLLTTRRGDLRAYLKVVGQSWREDSTNTDQVRLRARIRARLLPLLERDFSPRIVSHLCEVARFSREEQTFWSFLVEDYFQRFVTPCENGVAIPVTALLDPFRPLKQGPEARQSQELEPGRPLIERLIRRVYEELRGDRRELTSHHVEQVIRLATRSTSGRRLSLPGGIAVERVFDELRFSRRSPDERAESPVKTVRRPAAYEYVVALPLKDFSETGATVSVPELGTRFCLKLIDWAQAESETKRDRKVLDAESLRAPLILRNWRPGDSYTPFGRRQPRKLKQMFLAGRVPCGSRRIWPVLESAGQVVWARGMPAAEGFCAKERTRFGIVIEEQGL